MYYNDMYGMDHSKIYFFKNQKTKNMKVIIWIKTKDFNDFLDGKNVKYWTSEPCGINPDTVSITIDTDRYQQLMDSEDVG